jgi:hypothetical protein
MSEHNKYKVNGDQDRPKRTALHMQKPLVVEPREGYRRVILNDKPGEKERYIKAGWLPVVDKSANQSDKHIADGKHMGTELKLTVNRRPNAEVFTATVMEIPEEMYQEDMDTYHKILDDKEKGLNPALNAVNGSNYGELEVKRGKLND